MFHLADDPGDPGLGPVLLQSLYQGHGVTHIPDRRQPQQANVGGWVGEVNRRWHMT